MGELLRYPVFYIVLGGLTTFFPPVRENFWVGTITLGGLIALYAIFARRSDLNRQASGDNCYFIGFVYTLLLIAVSLGLHSGESGDLIKLLSAVATALATSVIGMLFRFGFTHGLTEPVDEMERKIRDVAVAADGLERAVETLHASVEKTEEALERAAVKADEYANEMRGKIEPFGQSMEEEGRALFTALKQQLEQQIVDVLQRSHFDGIREEFLETAASYRAALNSIDAAQVEAARRLKEMTDASAVNIEKTLALAKTVDSALDNAKWNEANAAIGGLGERLESLTQSLEKLEGKIAAIAAGSQSGVDRAQEMQAALAGMTQALRRDVETIAQIKENYRREFDKAAETALKETHQLYARLIAGAEIALKKLDDEKGKK